MGPPTSQPRSPWILPLVAGLLLAGGGALAGATILHDNGNNQDQQNVNEPDPTIEEPNELTTFDVCQDQRIVTHLAALADDALQVLDLADRYEKTPGGTSSRPFLSWARDVQANNTDADTFQQEAQTRYDRLVEIHTAANTTNLNELAPSNHPGVLIGQQHFIQQHYLPEVQTLMDGYAAWIHWADNQEDGHAWDQASTDTYNWIWTQEFLLMLQDTCPHETGLTNHDFSG